MTTADLVAGIAVVLLVLGVLTGYAHRRWRRPTTMQAVVGWSIIGAFCVLAVAASVVHSGLSPSAQPKLHDLQAAPVPPGAHVVATSTQRGGIDSSPQASLEYTLPRQPSAECVDVVRGYLDQHYTISPENLDTDEPQSSPVTSADSFCAHVTFAPPGEDRSADNSISDVDLIVCATTGDRSCFEATLTRPDPLLNPEAAGAQSVLVLTAS